MFIYIYIYIHICIYVRVYINEKISEFILLSLSLLCEKHLLGRCKTHIYSPQCVANERPKYRYHQSPTQCTKEFYWGYLQDYGWGVTYRSRNDSMTSVSPKLIPACVTVHIAGNLEHTAQPAGHSTGWRVFFLFFVQITLPDSWSGLRVFFSVLPKSFCSSVHLKVILTNLSSLFWQRGT